jgi:hypothetical protein
VAVEAAVDAGLGLFVSRTAGCGWGAAKVPLLLLLLPPPAEPAVRAWPLLLQPPPEWGVA